MIKKIISLCFIISVVFQLYGFPVEAETPGTPDSTMVIAVQSSGGIPSVKSMTLIKGTTYNRDLSCRDYTETILPGENRLPLLLIYNKEGDILYKTAFNYLSGQTVPPALPGKEDKSPDVIFWDNPEVYLLVPFFSDASSIEIYNPGETSPRVIEEITPLSLQVVEDFQANLDLTAPDASNPPPAQQGKMHFLVIASGYDAASIDTFISKASELKSYLLGIEPFQAYGADIEVHIYPNLADLGCYYNCNNIQRLLCCNSARVTSAAAASGFLFDEIIVLHNTDVYSGGGYREYEDAYKTNSYGSYAMSYHGPSFKQVILHELGHSFGNLCDEYTYTTEGYSYSLCVNCRENCSIWNSISQGCQLGCAARSDYYRPEDSIMLTLGIEYFNPVSLYATYLPDGLRERLLFFLGQTIPINVAISGERKEERAWLIKRHYGQIDIALENFENTGSQGNSLVDKVVIYRAAAGSGYESKAEIPFSQFDNLRYTYIDKYLDPDVPYTYRADALDSNGSVIQVSNEETI